MYLFIVEKRRLQANDLAALEKLEKRVMGETGIDSYTLQPLAVHGRIFTLESHAGKRIGPADGRIAGKFEVPQPLERKIGLSPECRILGAAEFIPSFSEKGLAHLFGFYVDDFLRGTGAAGTLLLCAERTIAQNCDVTRIDLTVSRDNGRAVAFYEKHGYSRTSYKRDYYGRGRHRLIMEKELRAELPPPEIAAKALKTRSLRNGRVKKQPGEKPR